MTRKYLLLFLLAGFVIVAPYRAYANKTVDAPYVDKGAAYVEWKGGYDVDNDDDVSGGWVQEFNAGYGVTDYWNVEVGGAVEHDGADKGNTDFTGVTIDNRFELTPPGEYFVDFGFSVAYGIATQDDAPDSIEGKLLFAKEVGGFSNLANIIIGREVGDNSYDKTLYGLALGSSYPINDKWSAGLEWYSDFGSFDDGWSDQSHQIGPALYGEITEGVGFETGVMLGISDAAPDTQIKAVIGFEF